MDDIYSSICVVKSRFAVFFLYMRFIVRCISKNPNTHCLASHDTHVTKLKIRRESDETVHLGANAWRMFLHVFDWQLSAQVYRIHWSARRCMAGTLEGMWNARIRGMTLALVCLVRQPHSHLVLRRAEHCVTYADSLRYLKKHSLWLNWASRSLGSTVSIHIYLILHLVNLLFNPQLTFIVTFRSAYSE